MEQWVFYGIVDPEQWIGIESDETALGKKGNLYMLLQMLALASSPLQTIYIGLMDTLLL